MPPMRAAEGRSTRAAERRSAPPGAASGSRERRYAASGPARLAFSTASVRVVTSSLRWMALVCVLTVLSEMYTVWPIPARTDGHQPIIVD
jgi:hypothetical protein